MIFGTCKLHKTTIDVMQILCSSFYLITYLTVDTLEGAIYDQHDCRRQITWNKSCVACRQIVKLLTSVTKQQCYSKDAHATRICVQYARHLVAGFPKWQSQPDLSLGCWVATCQVR